MTDKPRLLDLFCGAGGAAKGYQDAGFYVVGVDVEPRRPARTRHPHSSAAPCCSNGDTAKSKSLSLMFFTLYKETPR